MAAGMAGASLPHPSSRTHGNAGPRGTEYPAGGDGGHKDSMHRDEDTASLTALRLSGHLLIGVVRVHAKQFAYLALVSVRSRL